MTGPVAAIDCGTNSLRLLIADPGPEPGTLRERVRTVEIVRLGQGVDATGEFRAEALERTFAVLDDYAARIAAAGIDPGRTGFVATSAAREVTNRDAFFAGVRSRLDVVPEIVSGRQEAELSFTGALNSAAVRGRTGGREPVLVMDIGGGSTELILGRSGSPPDAVVSMETGSVRLTERFLRSSPPTPRQRREAIAQIDRLIDGSGLDLAGARSWVGVAGTVTTLAALHTGQTDPARLHASVVPQPALAGLAARLAQRSAGQIQADTGMHPGRADVITAGAMIAAAIGRRLSVDRLVVSVTDILDGIALRLLADGRIAR